MVTNYEYVRIYGLASWELRIYEWKFDNSCVY